MGCDIHAFVEFSKDGKYWRALTHNFGYRDYWLFGVLAGVRSDAPVLYPPRGMPEGPTSWGVQSSFWLNVAKNEEQEELDGWTSAKSALNWVENGYSIPEYEGDKLIRVSNPDWHSHSWLTPSELGLALAEYLNRHKQEPPLEWVALLSAMRVLEEGAQTVRVVFWFDN